MVCATRYAEQILKYQKKSTLPYVTDYIYNKNKHQVKWSYESLCLEARREYFA